MPELMKDTRVRAVIAAIILAATGWLVTVVAPEWGPWVQRTGEGAAAIVAGDEGGEVGGAVGSADATDAGPGGDSPGSE